MANINREKFLSALLAARPGLSSVELIEQSTNFVLDNDRVASYNELVTISAPCKMENISGVVLAKELLSLLKSLPKKIKEIELTGTENEILITAGSTKAGIRLSSDILLPLPKFRKSELNWQELPKNFNRGLKFVIFSTGNDAGRPMLNSVFADKKSIYASDSFRLTRFQLNSKVPSLLIPKAIAPDLVEHSALWVSKVQNQPWIHFKNKDNIIFSIRAIDGQWPSSDAKIDVIKATLYPEKGTGYKIELPEGIGNILSRIKIFASAEYEHEKVMAVKIHNNVMSCSSQGASGWIKEEFNVTTYTSREIEFKVHPGFFADIVAKSSVMNLSNNRLYFSGPGFRHALLTIEAGEE